MPESSAKLHIEMATVRQVCLPASLDFVAPARDEFLAFLDAMEMSSEHHSGWKLCFTELINNAIIHGVGQDATQQIKIKWSLFSGEVVLVIDQPGKGPIQPINRSRELPENLEQESGRGMFLVLNFVDKLEEWRGENVYRLVVRKQCPMTIEPPSSEMASILSELSASYEGLAAFYKLSESLVKADSLSHFLDTSLKDLRISASLDYLRILPKPGLPAFVSHQLKSVHDVMQSGELTQPLRGLAEQHIEIVWEKNEQRVALGANVRDFQEFSSGCFLPIMSEEHFFGHLVAGRKDVENPIASSQVNNLRTIADIYGVSIANFISSTIRREAEKDLREFEIAAEIQQHLLPVRQPKHAMQRSVRVFQRVAQNVAGDFAEYCQDRLGNHYLTIIDVMGKGVSAALLGIIYRTAFNLQMDDPKPLPAMLKRIARILHHMLGDLTMFITVTVLRWHDDSNVIEQVNAGHCPTIKISPAGDIQEIEPSGPPIGLLSNFDYACDQITMSPGDRIILVSDGCYEWRYREELYGWDRLIQMIREGNRAYGADVWNDLCVLMDREYNGENLSDDITMVFLREANE